MSETAGTGHRTTGTPVVHESYSFACLRCGHGWEQSYEIEHHVDAQGKEFVVYTAEGRRVPSPLSQPTCDHCDGHVVRIMRPGRVSAVLDSMRYERVPAQGASGTGARRSGPWRTGSTDAAALSTGTRAAPVERAGRQPWHMSHLLRLLHVQRRTH
ncbi:hypothetical protein GCM10018793_34360 [Streptomyces sulfonofaciens]|uniref:C2H2-type domain-containing protein n=1 Tax=Streptomyces sulfonofaciens TaxID=68272 RepID=A0A919L154_9ACTN|nr:hypothetical protein [Streptomyces sulfonofaciens]GHH80083.1 hypothetical protein GCM10018793_34360 [Streptomyces sulfonofaciens]